MRAWPLPLRIAARALLPGLALVAAGTLPPATAANEARTAAETYERKGRLADCLVYVAKDLGARAEQAGTDDPPKLLLVLDTTRSMANELEALKGALDEAWAEGPSSLRVGVMGIRLDAYLAPTRMDKHVKGMLDRLALTPVEGQRNVMAAVREAAGLIRAEGGDGPRAILLVTQEGGETEEDVEATRDAVFDSGAAFYCVAGEAAFEHAWTQPFQPREDAKLGLTERFDPSPRRIDDGSLWYGSEVAYPLIPYAWEGSFAQTSFNWVSPPAYPAPSGFGYWHLATLAFTSGGRYFIFDFPGKVLPKGVAARRTTMYDMSRLSQLAPDLRPRSTILKQMKKDARATTIVRIWEHLANEAVPLIQEIGTLERRGGLSSRPVRSISGRLPYVGWFEDLDDVKKAKRAVQERVRALDDALKWWNTTAGRAVTPREGVIDSLDARIEADFRLLGVQLLKARFHWGELLATIESVEPLDVTYRRVRFAPRVLFSRFRVPDPPPDTGDAERNALLASFILAQRDMQEDYASTPWSLMLEKGWTSTFTKIVEIVERDPPKPTKPPKPGDGDPAPAPPPKKPPSPPPAGPRPGSGSGGPTTGGG